MSALVMPTGSGIQWLITALIIAGVLVAVRASARSVRRGYWQILLPMFQVLAGVAFWLMLFPPHTALRLGALTVLTPGVGPDQLKQLPLLQGVIALPDVDAPLSIERAPDLAAALRRHPGTNSIDVFGSGLPPRDQPAAELLKVHFAPSAPNGITELIADADAPMGVQWIVRGHIAGRATQVQLRDVSGTIVDQMTVDKSGDFALSAIGRAAGPVLFKLQALDRQQALVDQASVPVVFRSGASLKMMLLAAGPDPDQKYWRRWAVDAGVQLSSSIGLSESVNLRDGSTALDAASLASVDLVLLDERVWALLSQADKAQLATSMDQGLGILLRVTGPVDAAVREQWAALGLPLASQGSERSIGLDQMMAMREPLPMTAAPEKFADHPQVMIKGDDGEPLAAWAVHGQGRIGALLITDTFRLVLRGEIGRYGGLWSAMVGQMARPRTQPEAPKLPQLAWLGERQVVCANQGNARILDPMLKDLPVLLDQSCMVIWPDQTGWYRVETNDGTWPFFVRALDDAMALRFNRNRNSTQAISDRSDRPAITRSGESTESTPVPRWPFLFAWLALILPVWWYERRILIEQ